MQQESGQKKSRFQAIKNLDLADWLLLIGAGLVFYGLFMVYRPAAYVGLGAGMIYYSIRMEQNGNNHP